MSLGDRIFCNPSEPTPIPEHEQALFREAQALGIFPISSGWQHDLEVLVRLARIEAKLDRQEEV